MTARPRVTVVMPVYNAAPFVAAAVASVLAQSFTAFELLVLDDGSTDGSLRVLEGIRDPRLRLVRRPHQGVVATMQAALELARADIVARADADDVCRPERLGRQVALLDARPEVAVCGAALRRGGQVLAYPADAARIRWTALYRNPFGNPTLAFRRRAALAAGGYPAEHALLDDYPFVSRLIARHEGANLPEVLVEQRVHPESLSARHAAAQRAEGDRVRRANLRALLDDETLVQALFYLLAGGPPPPGFRAAAVPAALDALIAAFRARWVPRAEAWRTIAPWIGRELFDRALVHAGAPAVLCRMALHACRLDRTLPLRARFGRGLVRHLALARRP